MQSSLSCIMLNINKRVIFSRLIENDSYLVTYSKLCNAPADRTL